MTALLQTATVTLNGLTLGADSPFQILEVSGFDDSPDVRVSDSPRQQADGDLPGTTYLGSRTVQVSLVAMVDDVESALLDLRRAFRLGPAELVLSGWPALPSIWLSGSVRRASIPNDLALSYGDARPKFEFYCPDPLRYAAAQKLLTLDLADAGVGGTTYDATITYDAAVPYDGTAPTSRLTYPVTYPVTYGGRAGLTQSLQARNEGLETTYPQIRVFGPAPSFSLVNSSTGRTLNYNATVSSGEYVEINMGAKTVLANSTASRRRFMSGQWWGLPPGDNSLAFLPDASAVGSRVEVRFRDAY